MVELIVSNEFIRIFSYLLIFFADTKKKTLAKTEDKFRTAKLLKNYKHYEAGKHIIKDLLKAKELSRNKFEEYFNDPDEANEVLGANVFSYHPENNTVTFHLVH
jgi:hypothetical protein